jgi:hypothetical protein
VLTDLNILQDEIDTQQDAYYKSSKILDFYGTQMQVSQEQAVTLKMFAK